MSILQNIQIFSPLVCLNQIKPEIIPLIQLRNIDELQAMKIDKQWKDINLIKWKTPENAEKNDLMMELWAEIYAYKDIAQNFAFEKLAEFVWSFLILPHSNAEVERTFSIMNCVKTKIQNRMGEELLSSILRIRFGLKLEESCCHNYAHRLPRILLKQVGTLRIYPKRKPKNSTTSRCPESGESVEKPPEDVLEYENEDDLGLDLFNDNLFYG